MEIFFAHQSFKWKNNALKNAGVTCVVVGIRPVQFLPKVLFFDSLSRRLKNISPYLIEGSDVYVRKVRKPIFLRDKMDFGSMPNDGGNLLLSVHEKKNYWKTIPMHIYSFEDLWDRRSLLKE